MTRFRTNPACEQVRAWAALAPDGELSEFEQASLQAHVELCGPCARFALQVQRIAALVRGAAPEALPHPVSLRSAAARRRSVIARVRPIAAAAAVALMAVGVASRAPLPVEERQTVTLDGAPVSAAADRREMEALRTRDINFFASDVDAAPLPTWSASRAV